MMMNSEELGLNIVWTLEFLMAGKVEIAGCRDCEWILLKTKMG